MSRENVEIVKDHYAATNERDFRRAMGHYADDVELQVPPGIRGGTFRGRKAVGDWFGEWFRTFDRDARFDIREITEIGDDGVLVVAKHRASGRGSGVSVEGLFIWSYRLSASKITHVKGFDSQEQALEASGLRE
jgi:ketosteroid isomerase-like protein